MHLLRVRKTVNVLEWGLPWALQTMGTWSMFSEVRALAGKLAFNHVLGAVEASLLSVRGADGGVQSC